jgi:LuxR family maltose regulon positive regulatory protein
MLVDQGRLREALDSYKRALQVAEKKGKAAPIGAADLHVGISEIYREQGDLEAATQHLMKSNEIGELGGLPENRYRWFTAMARVKQSENELDAALVLLDEAEHRYAGSFSPDVRPIHALRTRLWLLQGRLAEAERWVDAQSLSVSDELSYLREFQHLTLARVLLARLERDGDAGTARSAAGLLERLLEAAEAGGRRGAVIEILVLKALVDRAMGDVPASLRNLQRALALAEAEGYARIFLDEGPPVVMLLRQLANSANESYARRLLTLLHGEGAESYQTKAIQEPLSERELEVMRLLGTDMSGPDIARELVVSLNTLRTHTKSIYTKLGVNSRLGAVRRAKELDLL